MGDRLGTLPFGWSYLIGVGLVAVAVCLIVPIIRWHRRQR